MDRWNEHVAAWDAARARAVSQHTCFCAHGCLRPTTHVEFFVGINLPGLCDECYDLSRLKASKAEHFLMHRPTDTFIEDDEPSRLRRVVKRFLSIPARASAEDYVREYGPDGLRVVSDLYNKVVAGKHLTAAEAETVLRSKAAEVKASEAALRRIMVTERKIAKQMDLNRVYIGDDVADGDYAVIGDDGELVRLRVKRETDGGFRGFLFVNCIVGEGVQKWGAQYPQPHAWSNPDHRQFYRGHMAHLVAQMASNPAAARALYRRAQEGSKAA